jgi:hypothetical protein
MCILRICNCNLNTVDMLEVPYIHHVTVRLKVNAAGFPTESIFNIFESLQFKQLTFKTFFS